MSDPIQVGGSYTCPKCKRYSDGSDIHICTAAPTDEVVAAKPPVHLVSAGEGYERELRDVSKGKASNPGPTHVGVVWHEYAQLICDAVNAYVPPAHQRADDERVAKEIAWHYFPESEANDPVRQDLINRIASALSAARQPAESETWATIKVECNYCGTMVPHVCTAFLKGSGPQANQEDK